MQMSTEDLTHEQINYLFMATLSDWLNHSKRSEQEILFALKYVSLGSWCDQCRKDRFSDPMRFPLSVDHEKEPMVRANYRCHVCGHDWFCWWSQKEFVNTFNEEEE
jgi:hypothetical protein